MATDDRLSGPATLVHREPRAGPGDREPAAGARARRGHRRPGDMPPLHVHHGEDEAFYVIEGEL